RFTVMVEADVSFCAKAAANTLDPSRRRAIFSCTFVRKPINLWYNKRRWSGCRGSEPHRFPTVCCHVKPPTCLSHTCYCITTPRLSRRGSNLNDLYTQLRQARGDCKGHPQDDQPQ